VGKLRSGAVTRGVRNPWWLIATLCVTSTPAVAWAQGSDAGQGWRVGVTLGGISTFGLTFEAFWDSRSVDITVGTFGFRDVGVSVVGKQYIGGQNARPFVGVGLWGIVAAPPDEQTGLALVARVPIGVDWNFVDDHAIGAVVGINRALANERLVPLPGVYYRWTGS